MTTTSPLVPVVALKARESAILAATENAASAYAEEVRDHDYGPALRYSLLFACPESARAAGFGDLHPLDLFYNQYCWFRRFVHLHARKRGSDAGLEQQAFQLLEAAPADVDWNVLESLEHQACRDAP